jgi:hypothetical protein
MFPRIFPLLLLVIATLIPDSALAQWGRRFTVAAGPAIGVDGTPPNAGAHLRTSAALSPTPRTLNLLADAYITWLAPATTVDIFPGVGPVSTRDQETQVGAGLSALFTFFRQQTVSPYLLAGAVYRWSDASRWVEARDPLGQPISFESEVNEDQLDILFGLGTAISWGSRRLLLEARVYGGTAIYLPLTLGFTF